MYAVVCRRNMDRGPASENQDHELHDVFVPMVEVAPALLMAFKAPKSPRSASGCRKSQLRVHGWIRIGLGGLNNGAIGDKKRLRSERRGALQQVRAFSEGRISGTLGISLTARLRNGRPNAWQTTVL